MQESSVLSVSPLSPPSFNSYSSEKLSDIAARVVEELRKESESDPDSDIFNWPPKPTQPQPQQQQQQQDKAKDNNSDKEKREYEEEEEDDDDFEFAFVCREPDTTTISADEIFSNGQIRPTYPIFDQSLLLSLYDSHNEKTNTTTTTTTRTRTTTISTTKAPPSSFRRPPLRKLMIEEQERDRDTSCSSSEADDLEGVPDGTYCVWTPHSSSSSSSSCKKSHSTGSSKRWRFRDLLYRSNSDGKDTFVFLTPSKKAEKIPVRNNSISNSNKNKTTVVNKVEEENKRKSFLPYRKDLVGFFTNVNGLSRSLQPF
ncbi:hypothetical protein SO802_020457 [Lithocarpus litseifolius]|uniref:Uncharacterized protein n=1 Tax=Lithocarpus litseifolius TaxID=425828 RepID=A0AAW2CD64_9ROSI